MTGVAVLGGGVVGYGVAQMLSENGAAIARAAGKALTPKYILDIRDVPTPPGVALSHSLDEILADPDVGIVVETIGAGRGVRLHEGGPRIGPFGRDLQQGAGGREGRRACGPGEDARRGLSLRGQRGRRHPRPRADP